MENVNRGYKEAVGGVAAGLLIQVFIVVFSGISLIPSSYILLFQIIQVAGFIGDIVLIVSWKRVGIGFTVGWWLGMGIMVYVGLIEIWILIVYILSAIGFMALKLWIDSRNSGEYY